MAAMEVAALDCPASEVVGVPLLLVQEQVVAWRSKVVVSTGSRRRTGGLAGPTCR